MSGTVSFVRRRRLLMTLVTLPLVVAAVAIVAEAESEDARAGDQIRAAIDAGRPKVLPRPVRRIRPLLKPPKPKEEPRGPSNPLFAPPPDPDEEGTETPVAVEHEALPPPPQAMSSELGVVASDAPRSVYVNGDSLAQGAAPYLESALEGWTLDQDFEIGRGTGAGVSALKARGDSLPPFIVLSLGTNDDPSASSSFDSSIVGVLETAGSGRCVVWLNIVRPPVGGTSYANFNRALESRALAGDNLIVVDWATMTRENPSWLEPDGVHSTSTGYQARAAAIAAALRACRGKNPGRWGGYLVG
jgi:hypothetical protein